jgi:hypothetical protein
VQDLQGYLTEQKVLVVVKPFRVAQLEEAVMRALSAEGHEQPVTAREMGDGG